MDPGYLLALTTGVAGGFGHCIGMCGPIVASFALASRSGGSPLPGRFASHLFYNTGRITTYGVIGGLMGLSGSYLNVAGKLAGIQNIVAILAGIVMIAMGLGIIGVHGRLTWIEKHNNAVLHTAHRVLASSSAFRYYPLGLVLGLLPCGLSYTVFIASAGTGGLLSGAATALLFGLGTLPALLLFGTAVSSLSATFRSRIYRAGGVLVIIMGLYYLSRGIRLYAGL